jgi:hypothetical protein
MMHRGVNDVICSLGKIGVVGKPFQWHPLLPGLSAHLSEMSSKEFHCADYPWSQFSKFNSAAQPSQKWPQERTEPLLRQLYLYPRMTEIGEIPHLTKI